MKMNNIRASYMTTNEALAINARIAEAIKHDNYLKQYLYENVLGDIMTEKMNFSSLYFDTTSKMKTVFNDEKENRRLERMNEMFNLLPVLEYLVENEILNNSYGFPVRAILESVKPLIDDMEIMVSGRPLTYGRVSRGTMVFSETILELCGLLKLGVELGVVSRKHVVGDDRWYYSLTGKHFC